MQPVTHTNNHNLPTQLTPFVGREDELFDIGQRLADPNCRLLTLVGPGGMGKTRLALQAAAAQLAAFADGVFLVDLQPLQSTLFLVTAVADALELPLAGQTDTETQILRHLADKQMLLVLDNFEHLLDGADHLPRWLQIASGLKLLVTSREALNLQEEWLYPVRGLTFPQEDEMPTEGCTAVALFTERAQRVRPSFNLAEEEKGVVQICRLVDGMPLAIELASAWARSLSSAEIATEIKRNLDFLTTSKRNIPERHRSVQAIFDQTWQQLNPREQEAFKRLSVFRGGFQRDAASAVAGATLPILSSLVDKSLLRWEPGKEGGVSRGRYHIHELLRQYAAEILAQEMDDVLDARALHCRFYTNFLHSLNVNFNGPLQHEAGLAVEAELGNVRAAWQWAIIQPDLVALENAASPLTLFYQITSRYGEGAQAFKDAVAMLRGQPASRSVDLVLAELLVSLGWLILRLGQVEQAEALFQESCHLYQTHDGRLAPYFASDPEQGLAIIALVRGDYETADRLGSKSLQSEVTANHQLSYYILAQVQLAQGQTELAHQYAQNSYAASLKTGQKWFLAYALLVLGDTYLALGDHAAARQQYEASFSLRQEANDPEGMAVASNRLGKIAWQKGAMAEAEAHYERGLTIYREINDLGGLAESLTGLGETAVARGAYQTACKRFNEALQLTTDKQFTSLLLTLLTAIADLCYRVNQGKLTGQLLTFVLHHPAANHAQQEAAQQLVAQTGIDPPADPEPLSALLTAVQAGLASSTMPEDMLMTTQVPTPSSLIEPLTNRELEVLQLMADGLTNPEIAEQLIIAVGTVKSYTAQIYGKLEVRNRVEAVARARELNLLP